MIIDELKEIIDPGVRIPIDADKKILKIKEEALDAKLKVIKITGLNVKSTFAFKLDIEKKQLSPYLNRSKKNINKGCDAIIITITEKGKGYLFICELKSYSHKDHEVIAKMENSSLFLDYVNTIFKKFCNIKTGGLEAFSKKYILFHLVKINKRTSRPKQNITHETINNLAVYKAYNYHQINIGKLINLRG